MNRLVFLLATMLSLSILTACSQPSESSGAVTASEAPAMSVDVLKVERRTVVSYENLSGRARASLSAEIRPQVTGLITKRLFIEGEYVKSGQALYTIDNGDYLAAQKSAQASLERAQASANLAQETSKRYKQLADINAVSRQEYDEALAAAQQAAADISIQKAALDRAKLDLSRTTIKAPITGIIGRSSVTPGALVTENQANALATVAQLDPIYADLNVPSTRILSVLQQIADGKIESLNDEGKIVPVSLRLENGTLYEHKGELQFREYSVDENSGTVAVRAVVPNPDDLVLPGMYLQAQFSVGQYENAIVIPQRAVTRNARGEPAVFVSDNGKVAQRLIGIEAQSGSNWVVSSGLSTGDLIIVSHLQSLRVGASVSPQIISVEQLTGDPEPGSEP